MIFSKEAFSEGVKTIKMVSEAKMPTALIIFGTASLVAGAVMACVKSMEMPEIIEQAEEKKEAINELKKRAETKEEIAVLKKETFIFYKVVVRNVVKLYWIPAGLFVSGLGMIFASHRILSERNAALIVAYNGLDAAFKGYRERVKELFGEDADDKVRYFEEPTEKEVTVTKEDGTTEKQVVKGKRANAKYSPYARFFDEFSTKWVNNPQDNINYLRGQQQIANNILHTRGYIFLNEVYRALGIPETKEGQVVGWVEGNGDSYIDFGIYNGYSDAARDFVNNRESSILLDFNVDGVILDVFERKAALKW